MPEALKFRDPPSPLRKSLTQLITGKRLPPTTSPNLYLFYNQPVSAQGDVYVKQSRFHRSRKHHAQLRGLTLAIFRHPFDPLDHHSFITALLIQNYTVQVMQKDSGFARIYLLCPQNHDLLIYIKTPTGRAFDAWKYALTAATRTFVPGLHQLDVESVIGQGGGGKVFLVHCRYTHRFYALKVIDKILTYKSTTAFRHVAAERLIMEKIGVHPFLLSLEFAFQTHSNLYIGTPFCAGGDLAAYIRHNGIPTLGSEIYSNGQGKSTSKRLSERVTRCIGAEVLLGLEYLHGQGIVYRDLKLENVFLDEYGHVKIGDYGLARIDTGRKGTSVCGTRNYLPPEMICGKAYGYEVDLWSFGVMMYRMMVGAFPFDAMHTRDVFLQIRRCEPKVPKWISQEARSLLLGLLQKDGRSRLTIEQVKKHEFFEGVPWERVLALKEEGVDVQVDTGDVVGNFDVSFLQGMTMGEIVSEQNGESVVGFEFGAKSGRACFKVNRQLPGMFSKLASIDSEVLHSSGTTHQTGKSRR